MLKVVLTSFFFFFLLYKQNSQWIPFCSFVNSSFVLILYLEHLNFSTNMAEWLSRWTSDQTVVGSTPITNDLIFLRQIFFIITIFMIFFSILMCHKLRDRFYLYFLKQEKVYQPPLK